MAAFAHEEHDYERVQRPCSAKPLPA